MEEKDMQGARMPGAGGASKDYEVGYGRPPKHTRFRPGESGNRKGRPKGARGLKTDLKAELGQRVRVTENGKTLVLTKQQLMVKALAAKAAKGDVRAISKMIDLTLTVFGIDGDRPKAAAAVGEADQAIIADFLARGHGQEDRGDE